MIIDLPDYYWEHPPEPEDMDPEWYCPPFEPIVGLWDVTLSECGWCSYVVLPQ